MKDGDVKDGDVLDYVDMWDSRRLNIFETPDVVIPNRRPISAKVTPYSSINILAIRNRTIATFPLRLPDRNCE